MPDLTLAPVSTFRGAGTQPPSRVRDVPTRESLHELRRTREAFLSDPEHTDLRGVRDVIARSWRRSASCNVDPENDGRGYREPQLDATFLRIAAPVLDRLETLGTDTGVGIVLSDANGTVAALQGDRSVIRWAERHLVSVGSYLPEELAGTNGGGTAIEEGRGLQVWGAEHFAEELQNTFCTSIPVRNMLNGRTIGVLSLMVPETVALQTDPHNLSLVVEGAVAEIHTLILDNTARGEQALLRAYLRELRTRGGEAVVAMDDRTTILSRGAQDLRAESEHAILIAHAPEALPSGGTINRTVLLADERPTRIAAKPVLSHGEAVGSVVRLRQRPEDSRSRSGRPAAHSDRFADLVGISPVMSQIRDEATTALNQPLVAILGESGTGRGHLAGLLAAPESSPAFIECDPSRRDASEPPVRELRRVLATAGTVVCRNFDLLPDAARDSCLQLIRTAEGRAQIIITAYEFDPRLLSTSDASVFELRMPPLRSRMGDLPALVSYFLGKDSPERALVASQKLLAALTQAHWPGNVRDLRSVLSAGAAAAVGDVVCISDLSESQRHAITRGRLSKLEAAELEQIRHALIEVNGHKTRAADVLEISRSTLYRKMDRYSLMGYDFGR